MVKDWEGLYSVGFHCFPISNIAFGTQKVLGKKQSKENDFLMFCFTMENIKEN